MIPANDGTIVQVDHDVEEIDIGPISTALAMLQQIDRLLQKHASFWSHMEVVVDVLYDLRFCFIFIIVFSKSSRFKIGVSMKSAISPGSHDDISSIF